MSRQPPPPPAGRRGGGRSVERGEGLARRRPGTDAPARPIEKDALAAVVKPAAGKPREAPASARRVALEVLNATLTERPKAFDEAFDGNPRLGKLQARDRAFARLLVTTVLRHLGQIDKLIKGFVRYQPKSPAVRNLLRLGTAQLSFLNTPPHAAVGESMRLASAAFPHEAPMVNAVLRKIAAEGGEALAREDGPRLDTPKWLWDSWAAAYGANRARAIAETHALEPPLDITVPKDPEKWAAQLGAETLATGTLRRRGGGMIDQLPGFEEGAWWVQDAAAALPVQLMGELARRKVADLCAAPGGKTAQLIAAGADVISVERSPERAQYLARNLARLGMVAEIVVEDALTWQSERAPFDAVLLDAPCTATGTIRRHPDILWHKTPDDVARLAEIQGRLLAAAAKLVAPGGVLVYAVCSLQPEEGPGGIEAFLASGGGGLERDPIQKRELRGLPVEITAAGEVRTLPCHLAAIGGLDGFFIARLRRPPL
jgi:16S rRNA (cytosine967-C5)-methyltransferase